MQDRTDIGISDTGQDRCRTGWMQVRKDAGRIRYRTERMQDKANG